MRIILSQSHLSTLSLVVIHFLVVRTFSFRITAGPIGLSSMLKLAYRKAMSRLLGKSGLGLDRLRLMLNSSYKKTEVGSR
jgi:hypothetical protein